MRVAHCGPAGPVFDPPMRTEQPVKIVLPKSYEPVAEVKAPAEVVVPAPGDEATSSEFQVIEVVDSESGPSDDVAKEEEPDDRD